MAKTDLKELSRAYQALLMLEARDIITRDERMARLRVLNSMLPAPWSEARCEAFIARAIARGAKILDEVRFSASGKWQ